jgi:UDP-GlcNAc:undecaprenyl-phosphate GlcNAc-1-phosphate transferase
LAIVRRVGSGRSISSPDKKHLHHRLLAIGHSQRRAVLVLYAWSALLAAVVVGPTLADPRTVLVGAAGAALLLVTYLIAGALRQRRIRRAVRRHDNVVEHPASARRP